MLLIQPCILSQVGYFIEERPVYLYNIDCSVWFISEDCLKHVAHISGFSFATAGVKAQKSTYYMVLFDNIMHKLRATKFMQIVSEELGEDVSSFLVICLNFFLFTGI